MELVLLSGGSGKRLWPLSNNARSKQFLRVLKNEDGNLESMLQRVWRQLEHVGLSHSTSIATNKNQVDAIQNQLGMGVPIVVEPERRDTFPAIALAATYLYSIKRVSLDEVVIVLPVDSYVDQRYFQNILQLEEELIKSEADIGLIGVTPSYPSEKYGYILPVKSDDRNIRSKKVSHFVEKPDQRKAEELIREKALWNGGVFAFKLKYLISELVKRDLPIFYEELVKQYTFLPKKSFDYEIVEKANEIIVLPYNGYWKDLGTWNTLTEEMNVSLIGEGIVSDESTNTHVVNELDIPVIVIGIEDAVVASSPDGVLVTSKSMSPQIKKFLGDIERRPMYVEKSWGWYKVLEYKTYEDQTHVQTKCVGILAGRQLICHKRLNQNKVWAVVKGQGEFLINDSTQFIEAGDVLQVSEKSVHRVKAVTDMEIIEVLRGDEPIEEDEASPQIDTESMADSQKQISHQGI